MSLIPVTPGLLWLLEGAADQPAPDPRDFIEQTPNEPHLLDEIERDLDFMGFTQDTQVRPFVWTLALGPITVQAYRSFLNRSHVWYVEVRKGEKVLHDLEYKAGEDRQLVGDIQQILRGYREAGMFEAVNPKEFMEQTPDLTDFVYRRIAKFADLIPTTLHAEYGFCVHFFITATVSTVQQIIEKVVAEAGQNMEDVSWSFSPAQKPEKPVRRGVEIIFRKLR